MTYGILKELNEVALKHCRLELRIEHTQQVVVVVVVVLSHNQVRAHRTGSSHSGAEEYPREKHTQPKVVHGVYITADAINSCLHQKHIKVKLGVSLRCARSMPVHTSHYSRLQKPTIPIATRGRLPRIPYSTQDNHPHKIPHPPQNTTPR